MIYCEWTGPGVVVDVKTRARWIGASLVAREAILKPAHARFRGSAVEQLICNQWVRSSNLRVGTILSRA